MLQFTSTLWGMEQYFNYKERSLFENIRLPEGVDKQTLVDSILVEAGEFEVIYTNGDMLRRAIDVWFDRKYPTLERWTKAINIDYEPLENYNRTERWTYKSEGETSNTGNKNSTATNEASRNSTTSNTGSRNSTNTSTNTDKGTDTETSTVDNKTTDTTTVGAQTGTDETQVSAFNSSAYSPSEKVSSTAGGRSDSSSGTDKTTTDNTYTKNNTQTHNGTVADTTSDSGTVEDTTSGTGTVAETMADNGTSKDNSEQEGKAFGNIGVTTSQQMLESEMKLWATIDIYKEAADMFVQEFCIMIY